MVGLALVDPHIAPTTLMMASTAISSEPSAVDIVEVMAGRAVGGLTHSTRAWARMAREAVEPLVIPLKREICIAAVVETPDRPTIGVVTAAAILTEFLLVRVVGRVAAHAARLRIAEARRLVAGLT